MNKLAELKNSAILKELERRIKAKAIRFNYDNSIKETFDKVDHNLYPPQNISGLISWDATDKYELDFEELEKELEKEREKWERK